MNDIEEVIEMKENYYVHLDLNDLIISSRIVDLHVYKNDGSVFNEVHVNVMCWLRHTLVRVAITPNCIGKCMWSRK